MVSLSIFFLRLCAIIEICLYSFYFVYGHHGLQTIFALREKNSALERQVQLKEAEIQQVQKEIDDWDSYPFFKEQYARENLQMAHKDDQVYLI